MGPRPRCRNQDCWAGLGCLHQWRGQRAFTRQRDAAPGVARTSQRSRRGADRRGASTANARAWGAKGCAGELSVCDRGGLAIGPRASVCVSVRVCVRNKVLHGALRPRAMERSGVRVSNAWVPGARGLRGGSRCRDRRGSRPPLRVRVRWPTVDAAGAAKQRCFGRGATDLGAAWKLLLAIGFGSQHSCVSARLRSGSAG